MLCGMAGNTGSHAGSPKARQFGSAVREARGEDRSLRSVAKELGIDPSTLSKIENGKLVPKPALAEKIVDHVGLTSRKDELLRLLEGAASDQPWHASTLPEQRQHLAAIVAWEDDAEKIVEYTWGSLTGLLQTKGYARAVMSGGRRPLPPNEVSTRVLTRMARQAVLNPEREAHATLVAYIHVTALRQVIGGVDVMVDALEYVLKMMRRPNVEVYLIPDAKEWHEGLEGAFTLIEPRADADLYPVVFLDNLRSGVLLHADEDVAAYRSAVESLQQLAMTSTATEEVIASAIEALKTRPR